MEEPAGRRRRAGRAPGACVRRRCRRGSSPCTRVSSPIRTANDNLYFVGKLSSYDDDRTITTRTTTTTYKIMQRDCPVSPSQLPDAVDLNSFVVRATNLVIKLLPRIRIGVTAVRVLVRNVDAYSRCLVCVGDLVFLSSLSCFSFQPREFVLAVTVCVLHSFVFLLCDSWSVSFPEKYRPTFFFLDNNRRHP